MKADQIISVVAATTAVIAAVITVFLTRRSETIKQLQSLRISAYVDFIRAVAGLASIRQVPVQSKEHFQKQWELTMMLADAKARIAIYGSRLVLAALAELLRGGYELTGERAKSFTAICQLMRRDTRPKLGKASDHDMHFLLFDSELTK